MLFDKAPEAVTIPEGLEVSACLLSYHRPQNMPQIVARLLKSKAITDVVVWNNGPAGSLDKLDWPVPKKTRLEIIDSPHNTFTYGRFMAAACSRHSICYVQDDDCEVLNVDQIIGTFCTQARPRQIVHCLTPGHMRQRHVYEGGFHAALLGWGACFLREWADKAFRTWRDCHPTPPPSEATEGDVFYRKADRIFSLMQGREHITIPAVIWPLEGDVGREALSAKKDHAAMNELADGMAIEAFKRKESRG